MKFWASLAKSPQFSQLLSAAFTRATRAASELRPIVRRVDANHWVFEFRRLEGGMDRQAVPPETCSQCPQQNGEGVTSNSAEALTMIQVPSELVEDSSTEDKSLLCPSFSPIKPGQGAVFGIVVGEVQAPNVIWLSTPVPVTEELFDLTTPHHPSEMFRIANPCVKGHCKNFGGGICHLGRTVAAMNDGETENLPACSIRARCRWWHQEGPAACQGCSGVVTNNPETLRLRNALGK